MLVNDLADIIRAEGCSVTEVGGWKTHNHGSLHSVQTIVIHHTAGNPNGDYPSLNVVRNGRSDLPGPLAQLGVGRSGQVYVISSGRTYHAGTTLVPSYNNDNSIGIEVESVGDGTPWPVAQQIATAKVAAALCRKFGLPVSRVLGHKEICSPVGRKIDPRGIPGDMGAFRHLVQDQINGGAPELDATERMWLKGVSDSLGKYFSESGGKLAGQGLYDLEQKVNNLEAFVFSGGPSTADGAKPGVSEDSVIGRLKATEVALDEIKAALQTLINQHNAE